jgi:hypothetical protein
MNKKEISFRVRLKFNKTKMKNNFLNKMEKLNILEIK